MGACHPGCEEEEVKELDQPAGTSELLDEHVTFNCEEAPASEASNRNMRASIKPKPLDIQSKNDQMQRITEEGFFAVLDSRDYRKQLGQYGITDVEDDGDALAKINAMTGRVVCNDSFDGTQILGLFTTFEFAKGKIKIEGHEDRLASNYLWSEKKVVTFASLPVPLLPEADGVQLVDTTDLEALLARSAEANARGAKVKSMIRSPNSKGMQALVNQQLEIAMQADEHGLIAVLHMEVDIHAPEKERCERKLLGKLLRDLDRLEDQQVMLVMTVPTKPNTWLPLVRHPNVLRIMGLSGGYSRSDACKMLSQNIEVIASFGRAFLEGTNFSQTDEEFSNTIRDTCRQIMECSRRTPALEEMTAKISTQGGFIVDMDRDAANTAMALQRYGVITEDMSDEQITESMHAYIRRLVTHKKFRGTHIIGAVMHQQNMSVEIDDMCLPKYLWQEKNIIPILMVDVGVKPKENGVQLMEDVSNLEEIADKALQNQIFALKTRSVVHSPDLAGIQTLVAQQIELSKNILAKGLLPVLQLEISPASSDIAGCETMLLSVLTEKLGDLHQDEKIMLDLTIPEETNHYVSLIGHPNIVRLTAHNAGRKREESCRLLEKNVDLIASFGQAFTDGLQESHEDEEFTQVLSKSIERIFLASTVVPVKEIQINKIHTMDGFFAALDQDATKSLKGYCSDLESKDEAALQEALCKMRERVLRDPALTGSSCGAISLSEDFMQHEIEGVPAGRYAWETKHIVPFVKIDKGLQHEKNGVQLMKEIPHLSALLDRANDAGIFGTKISGIVKLPNATGIKALVDQQLSLAKQSMSKNLVPMLQVEVDMKSPKKAECESMLCHFLLTALDSLRPGEKIILWLNIPSVPNRYLSLLGHPSLIRLAGSSGGMEASQACRLLSANVGMIAGFGRAILESLREDMSDKDFTQMLDANSKAIFEASRAAPAKQQQMAKITDQDGLIATFDQSGIDKLTDILSNYGQTPAIEEAKLNEQVHSMRDRIIRCPQFNGSRILALVLTDDSMAREIGRLLAPRFLWEMKGIVPLLKIEEGHFPEKDGVQLMRGVNNFHVAMDKAVAFGCPGVKFRSIIKKPNSSGIRAAVDQQIEVAKQCLSRGLLPLMHLEVSSSAEDKTGCERILRQALMGALRQIGENEKVVLQLSIPETDDVYRPLVEHKKCARVLCLSGGSSQKQAVEQLSRNPGIVAAFGRALVEGLTNGQTDKEFTSTLGDSIQAIFQASCRDPPVQEVKKKAASGTKVKKVPSSKKAARDPSTEIEASSAVAGA